MGDRLGEPGIGLDGSRAFSAQSCPNWHPSVRIRLQRRLRFNVPCVPWESIRDIMPSEFLERVGVLSRLQRGGTQKLEPERRPDGMVLSVSKDIPTDRLRKLAIP